MTTLGERLRIARNKKNLKQTQVKERTNINNKTLSGYENGVSEPDADTLVVLADLYEVNYEWLLTGRNVEPEEKISAKNVFNHRLSNSRMDKKWTNTDIANKIGIPVKMYKRYEDDIYPEDYLLAKISELLEVSPDYLLGKTDIRNSKQIPSTVFTDKDELDMAKRMDKMKKDLIEGNADGQALNYMGEPMSEEAMESLLEALEMAERITTLANKKYAPKKYRDKE